MATLREKMAHSEKPWERKRRKAIERRTRARGKLDPETLTYADGTRFEKHIRNVKRGEERRGPA